LIFGPMFSGKTTELLRRMRRYNVANRSCLLIKHANDTRYDEEQVSTHDKHMMEAVPVSTLRQVEEHAANFQVIGIDEGQFFPDLVEFCESMANAGKMVVVAALDGTFQKKPFGRVLELIPFSEQVTKLNAVCMMCYKDAPFSRRIGSETQVELIGGADKYIACCRICFEKPFTVASTGNATPPLSQIKKKSE